MNKELEHIKEIFNLRINSIEKATTLAKESMEVRLAGMNEFREALKDQTSKFITKTEHELLINEIRELREFKIQITSKADQSSVNRIMLISIIGMIISIIAIIINWLK
jgi:subtilase family serine protease